jgi:hypothetical protein
MPSQGVCRFTPNAASAQIAFTFLLSASDDIAQTSSCAPIITRTEPFDGELSTQSWEERKEPQRKKSERRPNPMLQANDNEK